METTNLQQQRRRKFLLVLPLLVLPFATLLFWALGGGQACAGNPVTTGQTGFNSHLPEAKLKSDTGLTKLGYYDRAAADSAKLRQAEHTDPYAIHKAVTALNQPFSGGIVFSPRQSELLGNGLRNAADPVAKAKLISRRLTQLQAEVNKPSVPASTPAPYPTSAQTAVKPVVPQVLSAATEDPELQQMNGLLEKILDIQHPDRLREKSVSIAGGSVTDQFNAIPAEIDGNQKFVQGTVVRIRLLDSVRLNGQLFAEGQLIYGSGDLYNQRVKINIKLVHQGTNIMPVDLTVFDRTDGMEGINVPEAVTGDALRDGAVNGVQNMDIMSFDPSVGGQLTTAGINTAKGLFSKKVKRVKGKLKNHYQVLLRDNLLLKNAR